MAVWFVQFPAARAADAASELQARATELEQRLAALAKKPAPRPPAPAKAGTFVKGDAARVDPVLGEWEDFEDLAKGISGGSRDAAHQAIRSWLEAEVEPGDGHLWGTLLGGSRNHEHPIMIFLSYEYGTLWIIVRHESPEAARAQLEAHARQQALIHQRFGGEKAVDYRAEAGTLAVNHTTSDRIRGYLYFDVEVMRIAQHREFLIHVARNAGARDTAPRFDADLDRIIERSRALIDERFSP